MSTADQAPWPGPQQQPRGPRQSIDQPTIPDWHAFPQMPAVLPAPALWPVVLFTLLFGFFGAIAAAVQANKAPDLPSGRYWAAFGISLAGCAVLWSAFAVLVGALDHQTPIVDQSPVTTAPRSVMTAAQLDQSLVTSGSWQTGVGAPISATSAQCEAESVKSDGSGSYICDVTFADKSIGSYTVTVGSDGSWVTSPAS